MRRPPSDCRTTASRWSAPLNLLVALGIVVGLFVSGLLAPIDSEWTDRQFRLLGRDAASSDLVLVELDARSLHEIGVWPWPRSLHAKLIDNLLDAGAERIAFDIDLSAASTADEDRRLEATFARAGEAVILPTFLQAQTIDGQSTVAIAEPLPAFAQHSAKASINVAPEADGLVRRLSIAQAWPDGRAMPTMAAELAGVRSDSVSDFHLDFGLGVSAITRLSYLDVATGQFERAAVKGRKVIVSATAIELGDMIPVPIVRTMPGGHFQALAYESLTQGRALHIAHPTISLGLAALLMAGVCFAYRRLSTRGSLVVAVMTSLAMLVISGIVYLLWPVLLPVSASLVGIWLALLIALLRRIDLQALQLLMQSIRLRRSETTMAHVVENSFGGIITFDSGGLIETANAAACLLFGHDRAELIGQPIETLLTGLAPEHIDAASGIGLRESQGHRKTGAPFPVELALSRMELDGRITYIAVLQDITDRKRYEQGLVEAKQKAEEADRMKSAFLAQMSHELRTPLNAVMGFSEVIANELFGPAGAPQYKEYAADIYASGKHLLGIVTDILDISKLESGMYELEESEFELSGVFEAALKLIGHPARVTQTVRVALAPDLPRLRADARAVTQILVNLLSNAAKFSAADSAIDLSAERRASGAIRLIVRDRGIGMRPEDIPVALTPFRQIDSRIAREYEGTGLGLPIVAALMRLHGGRLEFESALGKGTSVIAEFPPERVVNASLPPAALAEAPTIARPGDPRPMPGNGSLKPPRLAKAGQAD